MSNWEPPTPVEPPTLPTLASVETTSAPPGPNKLNRWRRKFLKLPLWAWFVILPGLITIAVATPEPKDDGAKTRSDPPATQPFGDFESAENVQATPSATDSQPVPAIVDSGPTTTSTDVATLATAATAVPIAEATNPSTTPTMPATWVTSTIVDGDTLDVSGPQGQWRVRLVGMNAPEVGECFATESTDALRFLTTGELVLVTDVSDADRYDRKLRYIETIDGIDVGAEMVRNGFAISRRYAPDTARNDIYDRLQADAESAGLGLWAADACGPPTTDVSIEITLRYDADGDDNFNLNDEWVRFTNSGSAPLNLDGWLVADESASHRYTFHDLTLAQGAAITLYTGCGTDTEIERYWCNQNSAIWNNSGDTVFLRDPNGNNVVTKTY